MSLNALSSISKTIASFKWDYLRLTIWNISSDFEFFETWLGAPPIFTIV